MDITSLRENNILMENLKRIRISELLTSGDQLVGTKVDVKGWVRTRRGNKNVQFVALNDGSTIKNVQIVFDLATFTEEQLKISIELLIKLCR